jgi:hypothetical protein
MILSGGIRNGVSTLLQIDPDKSLEIVRILEDRFPTFYLKSTQMGLWKEKYVNTI